MLGVCDLFSDKSFMLQLDDWVLCRIYKKHSSADQKPATSVSSIEHSNDSSSSSHLDDVLESLPEFDDRFFTLPRTNSLRAQQQDDKLNFQNLGSGNFDWASLVGLNSVPELSDLDNQGQDQTQGLLNYTSNDMYVPSIPPLCHVESPPEKFRTLVEEEVQSGPKTQRIDNSGFFRQNSNVFTQNYSNSLDPYGFRYPNQSGGFGFRQ